MILGTGLGQLSQYIDVDTVIDYQSIPHFPQATAPGHHGKLVCGRLSGVSIVAMEGRFHQYEGYSSQQITLAVRVMKALGIHFLIVSNASGGLNPQFTTGDVVVIDDHVNLMWDNPLIGINDDNLGPRFPDMCRPYDEELIDRALQIARRNNLLVHRGIYIAVRGPSYETRAEYRCLRRMGDVVGMSTVPEVIVAVHAGLRVLALSTVTNMCLPDALSPTSADDVVTTSASTEPKLRAIVTGILEHETQIQL